MSTIGPVKQFTVGVASGVTASSALDLGGAYGKYILMIPTLTSGTDVRLQVCGTSDGTFLQLYNPNTITPTQTVSVMNFASTVTNAAVPIEIGAQYVKVEFTTAMTATSAQFRFICSTN
jgi:hypothetical protein